MKSTLIVLALVGLVVAGAGAQSASVTIQNQEEATFYYLIDPAALAGLSAGSPLLATKVAAFFAASKTDLAFSSLAPGGEAGVTNLTDGTHLLVGVFALDGQTDLPVRVISIEADSQIGDRFYAIFATPSELAVTRGRGRIASLIPAAETASATPATPSTTATAAAPAPAPSSSEATSSPADASPAATVAETTTAAAGSAAAAAPAEASPIGPSDASAQPLPASKLGQIASFASYDPVTFTNEKKGGFTVLAIADSRGWKLTGTRIAGLSGVLDSTGMHLALSVPSGFSENVSYFFYIFSERAAGRTNSLTLELLPRAEGSRGACLLWQKGSAVPQLLGSVHSSATTVALDLGADEMAGSLGDVSFDALTVDVTAGWYDRALGTWEEYYYTTISGSQIPVTR